jgi:DNA-binding MarR family transcriptional regulator
LQEKTIFKVTTMAVDKLFTLKKRMQIYTIIENNPGLSLMDLSRKTNIPKSTMAYHIRIFEKRGLIKKNQVRGRSRYYIANSIGNNEKDFLNLIRQPILRHILYNIFYLGVCSESDIVQDIEKRPSTVNYHLKKLLDADIIEQAPYKKGLILLKSGTIVERNQVTNEKFFRLKDPDYFYTAIIKYHKFLKNNEIDEFIYRLAKGKIVTGIVFKKINTVNKALDVFFDDLYEIFPHPYHA